MKMNQTWKKHGIDLRPGTKVKGKWHQKSYKIQKKLGQGAVGTVYLCKYNGREAALKISEQSTSMTVEVNVLKSLDKVQGKRLGPYLLDVDDWVSPTGKIFSFYVMEYLKGQPVTTFIQQNGNEWTGVFILQLLEDLERLHKSGWVFGDLKTDNLLVISSPTRIRWIDVGGTTQIGRAIKEYTEFFDRGYWKMGTRKAEPSYDLFALVMIILNVYYPNRFERGANPEATLQKRLNDVKSLKVYRHALQKALQGKYQTASEMKHDITQALYRAQHRKNKQLTTSKQTRKQKHRYLFLIESGGIAIIALLYYAFSLLLP
ncbi:protein kinase domain-containing protein [Oceanobacillus halotolerans]|uniref:protein kinase domain-containing protein n=1 Tax=Oceanobacillus halotolerans TaxID=2663380 RepID=UPI0013DCACBF|nr:protein kinase [Oceanobacillus halotolerans]